MLKSTIVGALLAAVAPPVAAATPDVPPRQPVVDVVTVNGSGCLPGTVSIEPDAETGSFSFRFQRFAARDGAGVGPVDTRKNCQITLLVHPPSGWTWSLTRVSHRGAASLAPDATALVRTRVLLSGYTIPPVHNVALPGPFEGAVAVDAVTPTDVAPCGQVRSVNLFTELRVSAPASPTVSTLALDHSDIYAFTLHPCP